MMWFDCGTIAQITGAQLIEGPVKVLIISGVKSFLLSKLCYQPPNLLLVTYVDEDATLLGTL